MNRLQPELRAQVLQLLCSGQSIQSVATTTQVSKNTVSKLLIDTGKACIAFHDANMRSMRALRIKVDVIWSFAYSPPEDLPIATAAKNCSGDIWTWTAVDTDTKLILSYLTGGRDDIFAMWFVDELCEQLSNRYRLSSNVRNVYLEAVEDSFGNDIDSTILVEHYGLATQSTKGHRNSAKYNELDQEKTEKDRDRDFDGALHSKQNDSNIRYHTCRLANITNAFRKKIDRYSYAVALHMMNYNFVCVQSNLSKTPAMAAGVSDRIWDFDDIVRLLKD